MKRAAAFALALALALAALPGAALADEYEKWNNILMLGADEASADADGTQTIVVLCVNTTDKAVRLISVMQDLAVMTEDFGERPLRELHSLGGPELLMEEMNRLFDLRMTRYILIDMTPLTEIIDTLGGVPLSPDETMREPLAQALSQAGLSLPEEGESYGGEQALVYSRLRARGESYVFNHSQRDVIIAASQKVLGSGVIACLRIVPKLFEMLTMNLPFGELIGIIYGLVGLDANAIPEMWAPKEVSGAALADSGWLLRVDGGECRSLFHAYVYGEASKYAQS